MISSFDLKNLLQETAASSKSGELQVTNSGITWTLYLTGTVLHFASHGLQTLDTLEQFLQQFGLTEALPLRTKLSQLDEDLSIHGAIAQLRYSACLSHEQSEQLLLAITEEAMESLLWLPQAYSQWQERLIPAALHGMGNAYEPMLERLNQRLGTWKTLTPVIVSPYQVPNCRDFVKLHQYASHGMLPGSTLEMMARMMQGISLRQLAFVLKQDVLKLCQLLYPYLSRDVLHLETAAAPFHGLPQIPGLVKRQDAPNRDTQTRDAYSRNTYSYESGSVRPSQTQKATTKVYKVVCIDDSPTVLDMIQRYLGTERFDVATVEDPMASLSALFDMKPDLILMDVSMPGIDGNRLCQILKRSSVFTHVPIIMVSGNAGLLDKEKAKAAGATDYLIKPFSQAELLAIVDQHLAAIPC
jgi:two-component system, chemotaxis family, response regulator PixG